MWIDVISVATAAEDVRLDVRCTRCGVTTEWSVITVVQGIAHAPLGARSAGAEAASLAAGGIEPRARKLVSAAKCAGCKRRYSASLRAALLDALASRVSAGLFAVLLMGGAALVAGLTRLGLGVGVLVLLAFAILAWTKQGAIQDDADRYAKAIAMRRPA